MPKLYFSLSSLDSEPFVERIAAECESFLEGECVLGIDSEVFAPKKIRNILARCDVLIVVIGEESPLFKPSDLPIGGALFNERIRFEIISGTTILSK